LRREADDAIGVAYAQHNVAVAHQGLGDDATAIELCEQALAIYATEDVTADDRATMAAGSGCTAPLDPILLGRLPGRGRVSPVMNDRDKRGQLLSPISRGRISLGVLYRRR